MLSLLSVASLLITVGNSCSIAQPPFGTYYIANVQALNVNRYPDDVLLTIRRITTSNGATIGTTTPRLTFDDATGGPWCKLMNVNDGSVGEVVPCDDYSSLVRDYATVDTSTTTVSCDDNCDGSTATCTINRGGTDYTFADIRFDASSTSCDTDTDKVITIGGGNGVYTAFTLEDISTTYIVFSTNTVGVVFDDSTDPATTTIMDVELVGDFADNLSPGSSFGFSPQFYYDVNVASIALPCCLCYGAIYAQYTIESATSSKYDQVITFSSIGSDTNIDSVQERGINTSIFFGNIVTIYDLSDGSSSEFEPNLCDVIVSCLVDPCDSASCPYNPTATCIADYCGGCNARWYCGEADITTWCDSTPNTNSICPTETPAPTTPGPTSQSITCANVDCTPDKPICVEDYLGKGEPGCVAEGDSCGSIANGDCGGCKAACFDCDDGINSYGCCSDGYCYYSSTGECLAFKPESLCPDTDITPSPTEDEDIEKCALIRCSADKPNCVEDDGTGSAACVALGDKCETCIQRLGMPCGTCPDGKNYYGACLGCTWQQDGDDVFCADTVSECPDIDTTTTTMEPEDTTSSTMDMSTSTTEEEDNECPRLDKILYYVFEWNLAQRACDICLYEGRGNKKQRTCERIASFIGNVVVNYYGECMLNVCDYPCTLDQLIVVAQDDDEECGCDTFTCSFSSNANNVYNKVLILIFCTILSFFVLV